MNGPVDLRQALAFPGIYLEPPAGLPALAPAPRVRRPGRIRRRVAALAAAAATTAVTLAGYSTPAQAASRPVWDGSGTYSSGIQPLCPARLAGHTARAGAPGHKFTVTCEADGLVFVWDAVTPVSLSTARVGIGGSETATAVFRGCVYGAEAYAESHTADDDVEFSGVHHGHINAGHPVRLAVPVLPGDQPGPWGGISVIAWQCGTGRLVQLDSGASFMVVTK